VVLVRDVSVALVRGVAEVGVRDVADVRDDAVVRVRGVVMSPTLAMSRWFAFAGS
jgi:hypothetical protein